MHETTEISLQVLHPSLGLAPGVSACRHDDHLVFFSIKRDEYLAIPSPDGCPIFSALREAAEAPVGHALATDLVRQGILTTSAQEGSPYEEIKHRAKIELSSIHITGPNSSWLSILPKLGYAYLWARIVLRFRSLSEVFNIVGGLRKTITGKRGLDEDDLSLLLYNINTARTFLYDRRNNCMLNSLAILKILSSYGVFPSWTFGVKLSPFEAHCWLEDGHVLIDDQLMIVSGFTPIARL